MFALTDGAPVQLYLPNEPCNVAHVACCKSRWGKGEFIAVAAGSSLDAAKTNWQVPNGADFDVALFMGAKRRLWELESATAFVSYMC